MFDSIEEMALYIKQILSTSADKFSAQYEESIKAIKKLQETLSLVNLTDEFNKQLKIINL